jgi:hypothetical protein
MWKRNGGSSKPSVQKTKSTTGKRVNSSPGLTNLLKNI